MTDIPPLMDSITEAQAILDSFYKLHPNEKPQGQAAIDSFQRLQELCAAHDLRTVPAIDDDGNLSRDVLAPI